MLIFPFVSRPDKRDGVVIVLPISDFSLEKNAVLPTFPRYRASRNARETIKTGARDVVRSRHELDGSSFTRTTLSVPVDYLVKAIRNIMVDVVNPTEETSFRDRQKSKNFPTVSYVIWC